MFNKHIQKAENSAQVIVIGSDFNPIANAFAKLKALFPATLGSMLDLFTPDECANFKAAGYDPD